MRRTEQERKRLAVPSALRNARRLLLLSDNPLIEETTVAALPAERYANAILAQELALSDLVLACGERMLERIRGDRRLERRRRSCRRCWLAAACRRRQNASRGAASISPTPPGGRSRSGCLTSSNGGERCSILAEATARN